MNIEVKQKKLQVLLQDLDYYLQHPDLDKNRKDTQERISELCDIPYDEQEDYEVWREMMVKAVNE